MGTKETKKELREKVGFLTKNAERKAERVEVFAKKLELELEPRGLKTELFDALRDAARLRKILLSLGPTEDTR